MLCKFAAPPWLPSLALQHDCKWTCSLRQARTPRGIFGRNLPKAPQIAPSFPPSTFLREHALLPDSFPNCTASYRASRVRLLPFDTTREVPQSHARTPSKHESVPRTCGGPCAQGAAVHVIVAWRDTGCRRTGLSPGALPSRASFEEPALSQHDESRAGQAVATIALLGDSPVCSYRVCA